MSLSIPPLTLVAVFFILLFAFSSVFIIIKVYNTLMSVPRIDCVLDFYNITSSRDQLKITIWHRGGSTALLSRIILNGRDNIIIDSFNTTITIKGYNVTVTVIGVGGLELLSGNNIKLNITIEPSLFYNTTSSGILVDLEKVSCVIHVP